MTLFFVPLSQNLRLCPKCNRRVCTVLDADGGRVVVEPVPPSPPHGLGGPICHQQGPKGAVVAGQKMPRHQCQMQLHAAPTLKHRKETP